MSKARERWLHGLQKGDRVRLLRMMNGQGIDDRIAAASLVEIDSIGAHGGPMEGMAILSSEDWRSREVCLRDAVDPPDFGHEACKTGPERSLWLASLEPGDPVWVDIRRGQSVKSIACRIEDIREGYLWVDRVNENFPVTTGNQGNPPIVKPVGNTTEIWNIDRQQRTLRERLRDHDWSEEMPAVVERVCDIVFGHTDFDAIEESL